MKYKLCNTIKRIIYFKYFMISMIYINLIDFIF